ncbi:hypothetical protein Peur_033095 [Populus x canadensis]
MSGPGSGQFGAIFSHGNKNYVRMPSFRRKEKSKIISLKSTSPIKVLGVLLWNLASVDGVDDNLTNRSSTTAVMAPPEKVEKAGYSPQSLLLVSKNLSPCQLDLAPRNDSSGESTRRSETRYMHGDPARNVVAAALPQHYSVLPDSVVWSIGAVTTASVRSGGL